MDPFGTAALRAATLAAWRDSPTRLAEDAAAEADFADIGYRDRVFVELLANAADAAVAAGLPPGTGRVSVRLEGDRLHVANTGAPLTESGVASLLALRVSPKSGSESTVGRFGVGFSAVAAVADAAEIRSTTGSIRFDRAATRDELERLDLAVPGGIEAPLLRLAWSTDVAPAAGFDTEVVLTLAPGVDGEALVAAMADQAPDLLPALPALGVVEVGGNRFVCEVEPAVPADATPESADVTDASAHATAEPDRVTVTVTAADGTVTARRWLRIRAGAAGWLARITDDGDVIPLSDEVLYAPTPTEVASSLPVRFIGSPQLAPDRRRLHPDADIAALAAGYPELLRAVPPDQRLRLVPEAGFGHNEVDAQLRAAVIDALREADWLPVLDGTLAPVRAAVLPDLTEQLAEVVDVFTDLVIPELAGRPQLAVLRLLGVDELSPADLVARLAGLDREPAWWHRLYEVLAGTVAGPADAEEFGALPIPRADGRRAFGGRGLVFIRDVDVAPPWLPTVHPEAVHPLLELIGVAGIGVTEALDHPGLRELVEHPDEVSDESGSDSVLDSVLGLLVADPSAAVPDWLGALELPTDDGDLRPADELLLPGSPLRSVLVADSPFGTVAPELVDRVGPEVLRRLGSGWGFTPVVEELPTEPDPDLDDADGWWDGLPEPPETLAAVRDLDLVDDDRWPQALSLLVDDPEIAAQLADPDGYTVWWLRRHAHIDGNPVGRYRAAAATGLVGVLDELPGPLADRLGEVLVADELHTADQVQTVLENLADPERDLTPAQTLAGHTAVVAAITTGRVAVADVEPPLRVRTAAGTVVDDAPVCDHARLLQVLDPDEFVLAGVPLNVSEAATLADLLDRPAAGEVITARVLTPGEAIDSGAWAAVRFAAEHNLAPLRGSVRICDDLRLLVDRAGTETEHAVAWWVDDGGDTFLRS